jgi:hypothetical protein
VRYGGPAGARVLQKTGEYEGPEGALRSLLSDLEEEVDEKMKFHETEGSEDYADSMDLDQIPIIEPDQGPTPSMADMDTVSSHDASATPTQGRCEREKALQATYSDTDLVQESYTNLNPPSATSIGEGDGRFDPRYVTNDYLRDQSFAERIPPVAPLQYTSYRKPQPLHQDRYLPYQPRKLEQEGMEYRPYRKDFW